MKHFRTIGLFAVLAFLAGVSGANAGSAMQAAPSPTLQEIMPEVFSFPEGRVKLGEPATIKWSYPASAQIRLLLFRNGQSLGVIADGLSHAGGIGQYQWEQAGHYNGGTASLGGGYRIKVKVQGKPGVSGMSKFPFDIYQFEQTPEGLTTAKPKVPFNIAATKITRNSNTMPGGQVLWNFSGFFTTNKPLDVLYGKLTINADNGSFHLEETGRVFNASTQYESAIIFTELDVPSGVPITAVFEADYDNRWNDGYKGDNTFTWKTILP